MSYYQIEDIIEDSICLVNKTTLSKWEKRDLIYHLYQFHDRFDTSYTRFRVLNILQENCYLYSLPISKHPDYLGNEKFFNQFDESAQEWIPAYIENEEKGSVYLEKQNIWFEVNDEFWLRVQARYSKEEQKPPQEITVTSLFLSLLKISFQLEDFLFAKRWYASFVNSILQFDVDENDGIPNKFKSWLKHSDLLQIRASIEENQHILSLKDAQYRNDELLAFPKLRDELEFETEPDRRAIARFLLDIKISIDDIEKKYRKEIGNPLDLTKYERIYDFFREKLDHEWKDGIKEIGKEEGIITFLRKSNCKKRNSEAFYNCIIIDYTTDIKTISFKIGIQNAQILSWQNREASSKPERQHFIEDLFLYIDDEEIEADKNISSWGGWKYDIKHTQKTLDKRLSSMWFFYEKYSSNLNSFYCSSLSHWLGIDRSDQLMKKRKRLLNKGINFFGNEMDFKLFAACLNLKNGHPKIAEKLIKEVENLLTQGLGSEQLKERIKQGLSYMDESKHLAYPEISTIYSRRLYRK